MKSVYRKKVVVIPYTSNGQFLFVKDRKTTEWGFICGGVKRNEREYYAANRELREETSNLFHSIPFHDCFVYKYVNDYRPLELLETDKLRCEKVISYYEIFMFKVDNLDIKDFKSNDEILDIKFSFFDEVDNVWELTHLIYDYLEYGR